VSSRATAPPLRSALLIAAVVAVLGLAACGGGDSSSSTGASGASGASGEQGATSSAISTSYEKPSGSKSDAIGAELLKAVDIGSLADVLATTFEIPTHITVKAVNGIDGGPHWDPSNDTITFQYGFAALIYDTLKQANPDWSQHKLGYATGATLGFIMEHEFTHALISIYDIPVLGREEDAADTLATLLLLKSAQGDKLALSAAEFWADFSGRQDPPQVADYADEHSLDLQRAYAIICDIAGSNQARYDEINQAGLLPNGDIKSCPAQYQEDVKNFTEALQPHVKGGELNFQAPG
jgi:hypothetical protein